MNDISLQRGLLDLAQVRTFVAIADAGSFIRAAQHLGVSQPSVSQHISKLEAQLGVQLFRRNRGECTATADGAKLLPNARALLAAEARCRAALAGLGSISIAASSNIGVYHLPRALRLFQEAHGVQDVKVSIGPNASVYEKVETLEADIGLTEWWDRRDRLAAIEWHKEKLFVIVPPRHPWATRTRVAASELLAVPMIGGEPGTGTAAVLREAFGSKHELKMSMTLGSTEAVKRAVMEGLGISIVMRGAVDNEVAQGRLRVLPIAGKPLMKPLFAVFPRSLDQDSLPGSFVAFLRKIKF